MMKCFARLTAGESREKRVFIAALIVGAAMLFCDVATKLYFTRTLLPGERITVIPGWFDLTLVGNTGAAWSILAGHGYLLLGIGILVAVAICYFFRALTEECPERYFAMFLILSGIIGNSIDRLWRGAVIDFLSFHYFDSYYYPVFNVADIAICCGVGIYLISGFCRKAPREK